MELFVKRFIDLLDEIIPVSMVHTITEQPLGSVMLEHYVRIHARVDLAVEESPYVEIELFPHSTNKMGALFAYTYPINGIQMSESDFVNKLKKDKNISVEKIVPLENEQDYYFEIFYELEFDVPERNGEIDEMIHEIIPIIKEWLLIGDYQEQNEE